MDLFGVGSHGVAIYDYGVDDTQIEILHLKKQTASGFFGPLKI